ncbi:NUDIX hydrolase [Clostridium amazonitimonense]|uniref:NUDIX hydrolase n=1 Tax=Clostridium amazonitimonense TaxID=1499689 RepID=UPI000AA49FF8
MTIDNIAQIFNKKQGKIMGDLKKSAVMLLLQDVDGKPHLIFEVRALTLRHQPGDICLPGGKIENMEKPKEAAIRETMEELNLQREDIEYLGEMDYFVTPYSSIIYPFVGKISSQKILNPSPYEVDHIFKVPLEFLIKEKPIEFNMEIGPRNTEGFPFHLINRGKDYKFSSGIMPQYFYQYENYIIWGFTARIVREFIKVLEEELN